MPTRKRKRSSPNRVVKEKINSTTPNESTYHSKDKSNVGFDSSLKVNVSSGSTSSPKLTLCGNRSFTEKVKLCSDVSGLFEEFKKGTLSTIKLKKKKKGSSVNSSRTFSEESSFKIPSSTGNNFNESKREDSQLPCKNIRNRQDATNHSNKEEIGSKVKDVASIEITDNLGKNYFSAGTILTDDISEKTTKRVAHIALPLTPASKGIFKKIRPSTALGTSGLFKPEVSFEISACSTPLNSKIINSTKPKVNLSQNSLRRSSRISKIEPYKESLDVDNLRQSKNEKKLSKSNRKLKKTDTSKTDEDTADLLEGLSEQSLTEISTGRLLLSLNKSALLNKTNPSQSKNEKGNSDSTHLDEFNPNGLCNISEKKKYSTIHSENKIHHNNLSAKPSTSANLTSIDLNPCTLPPTKTVAFMGDLTLQSERNSTTISENDINHPSASDRTIMREETSNNTLSKNYDSSITPEGHHSVSNSLSLPNTDREVDNGDCTIKDALAANESFIAPKRCTLPITKRISVAFTGDQSLDSRRNSAITRNGISHHSASDHSIMPEVTSNNTLSTNYDSSISHNGQQSVSSSLSLSNTDKDEGNADITIKEALAADESLVAPKRSTLPITKRVSVAFMGDLSLHSGRNSTTISENEISHHSASDRRIMPEVTSNNTLSTNYDSSISHNGQQSVSSSLSLSNTDQDEGNADITIKEALAADESLVAPKRSTLPITKRVSVAFMGDLSLHSGRNSTTISENEISHHSASDRRIMPEVTSNNTLSTNYDSSISHNGQQRVSSSLSLSNTDQDDENADITMKEALAADESLVAPKQSTLPITKRVSVAFMGDLSLHSGRNSTTISENEISHHSASVQSIMPEVTSNNTLSTNYDPSISHKGQQRVSSSLSLSNTDQDKENADITIKEALAADESLVAPKRSTLPIAKRVSVAFMGDLSLHSGRNSTAISENKISHHSASDQSIMPEVTSNNTLSTNYDSSISHNGQQSVSSSLSLSNTDQDEENADITIKEALAADESQKQQNDSSFQSKIDCTSLCENQLTSGPKKRTSILKAENSNITRNNSISAQNKHESYIMQSRKSSIAGKRVSFAFNNDNPKPSLNDDSNSAVGQDISNSKQIHSNTNAAVRNVEFDDNTTGKKNELSIWEVTSNFTKKRVSVALNIEKSDLSAMDFTGISGNDKTQCDSVNETDLLKTDSTRSTNHDSSSACRTAGEDIVTPGLSLFNTNDIQSNGEFDEKSAVNDDESLAPSPVKSNIANKKLSVTFTINNSELSSMDFTAISGNDKTQCDSINENYVSVLKTDSTHSSNHDSKSAYRTVAPHVVTTGSSLSITNDLQSNVEFDKNSAVNDDESPRFLEKSNLTNKRVPIAFNIENSELSSMDFTAISHNDKTQCKPGNGNDVSLLKMDSTHSSNHDSSSVCKTAGGDIVTSETSPSKCNYIRSNVEFDEITAKKRVSVAFNIKNSELSSIDFTGISDNDKTQCDSINDNDVSVLKTDSTHSSNHDSSSACRTEGQDIQVNPIPSLSSTNGLQSNVEFDENSAVNDDESFAGSLVKSNFAKKRVSVAFNINNSELSSMDCTAISHNDKTQCDSINDNDVSVLKTDSTHSLNHDSSSACRTEGQDIVNPRPSLSSTNGLQSNVEFDENSAVNDDESFAGSLVKSNFAKKRVSVAFNINNSELSSMDCTAVSHNDKTQCESAHGSDVSLLKMDSTQSSNHDSSSASRSEALDNVTSGSPLSNTNVVKSVVEFDENSPVDDKSMKGYTIRSDFAKKRVSVAFNIEKSELSSMDFTAIIGNNKTQCDSINENVLSVLKTDSTQTSNHVSSSPCATVGRDIVTSESSPSKGNDIPSNVEFDKITAVNNDESLARSPVKSNFANKKVSVAFNISNSELSSMDSAVNDEESRHSNKKYNFANKRVSVAFNIDNSKLSLMDFTGISDNDKTQCELVKENDVSLLKKDSTHSSNHVLSSPCATVGRDIVTSESSPSKCKYIRSNVKFDEITAKKRVSVAFNIKNSELSSMDFTGISDNDKTQCKPGNGNDVSLLKMDSTHSSNHDSSSACRTEGQDIVNPRPSLSSTNGLQSNVEFYENSAVNDDESFAGSLVKSNFAKKRVSVAFNINNSELSSIDFTGISDNDKTQYKPGNGNYVSLLKMDSTHSSNRDLNSACRIGGEDIVAPGLSNTNDIQSIVEFAENSAVSDDESPGSLEKSNFAKKRVSVAFNIESTELSSMDFTAISHNDKTQHVSANENELSVLKTYSTHSSNHVSSSPCGTVGQDMVTSESSLSNSNVQFNEKSAVNDDESLAGSLNKSNFDNKRVSIAFNVDNSELSSMDFTAIIHNDKAQCKSANENDVSLLKINSTHSSNHDSNSACRMGDEDIVAPGLSNTNDIQCNVDFGEISAVSDDESPRFLEKSNIIKKRVSVALNIDNSELSSIDFTSITANDNTQCDPVDENDVSLLKMDISHSSNHDSRSGCRTAGEDIVASESSLSNTNFIKSTVEFDENSRVDDESIKAYKIKSDLAQKRVSVAFNINNSELSSMDFTAISGNDKSQCDSINGNDVSVLKTDSIDLSPHDSSSVCGTLGEDIVTPGPSSCIIDDDIKSNVEFDENSAINDDESFAGSLVKSNFAKKRVSVAFNINNSELSLMDCTAISHNDKTQCDSINGNDVSVLKTDSTDLSLHDSSPVCGTLGEDIVTPGPSSSIINGDIKSNVEFDENSAVNDDESFAGSLVKSNFAKRRVSVAFNINNSELSSMDCTAISHNDKTQCESAHGSDVSLLKMDSTQSSNHDSSSASRFKASDNVTSVSPLSNTNFIKSTVEFDENSQLDDESIKAYKIKSYLAQKRVSVAFNINNSELSSMDLTAISGNDKSQCDSINGNDMSVLKTDSIDLSPHDSSPVCGTLGEDIVTPGPSSCVIDDDIKSNVEFDENSAVNDDESFAGSLVKSNFAKKRVSVAFNINNSELSSMDCTAISHNDKTQCDSISDNDVSVLKTDSTPSLNHDSSSACRTEGPDIVNPRPSLSSTNGLLSNVEFDENSAVNDESFAGDDESPRFLVKSNFAKKRLSVAFNINNSELSSMDCTAISHNDKTQCASAHGSDVSLLKMDSTQSSNHDSSSASRSKASDNVTFVSPLSNTNVVKSIVEFDENSPVDDKSMKGYTIKSDFAKKRVSVAFNIEKSELSSMDFTAISGNNKTQCDSINENDLSVLKTDSTQTSNHISSSPCASVGRDIVTSESSPSKCNDIRSNVEFDKITAVNNNESFARSPMKSKFANKKVSVAFNTSNSELSSMDSAVNDEESRHSNKKFNFANKRVSVAFNIDNSKLSSMDFTGISDNDKTQCELAKENDVSLLKKDSTHSSNHVLSSPCATVGRDIVTSESSPSKCNYIRSNVEFDEITTKKRVSVAFNIKNSELSSMDFTGISDNDNTQCELAKENDVSLLKKDFTHSSNHDSNSATRSVGQDIVNPRPSLSNTNGLQSNVEFDENSAVNDEESPRSLEKSNFTRNGVSVVFNIDNSKLSSMDFTGISGNDKTQCDSINDNDVSVLKTDSTHSSNRDLNSACRIGGEDIVAPGPSNTNDIQSIVEFDEKSVVSNDESPRSLEKSNLTNKRVSIAFNIDNSEPSSFTGNSRDDKTQSESANGNDVSLLKMDSTHSSNHDSSSASRSVGQDIVNPRSIPSITNDLKSNVEFDENTAVNDDESPGSLDKSNFTEKSVSVALNINNSEVQSKNFTAISLNNKTQHDSNNEKDGSFLKIDHTLSTNSESIPLRSYDCKENDIMHIGVDPELPTYNSPEVSSPSVKCAQLEMCSSSGDCLSDRQLGSMISHSSSSQASFSLALEPDNDLPHVESCDNFKIISNDCNDPKLINTYILKENDGDQTEMEALGSGVSQESIRENNQIKQVSLDSSLSRASSTSNESIRESNSLRSRRSNSKQQEDLICADNQNKPVYLESSVTKTSNRNAKAIENTENESLIPRLRSSLRNSNPHEEDLCADDKNEHVCIESSVGRASTSNMNAKASENTENESLKPCLRSSLRNTSPHEEHLCADDKNEDVSLESSVSRASPTSNRNAKASENTENESLKPHLRSSFRNTSPHEEPLCADDKNEDVSLESSVGRSSPTSNRSAKASENTENESLKPCLRSSLRNSNPHEEDLCADDKNEDVSLESSVSKASFSSSRKSRAIQNTENESLKSCLRSSLRNLSQQKKHLSTDNQNEQVSLESSVSRASFSSSIRSRACQTTESEALKTNMPSSLRNSSQHKEHHNKNKQLCLESSICKASSTSNNKSARVSQNVETKSSEPSVTSCLGNSSKQEENITVNNEVEQVSIELGGPSLSKSLENVTQTRRHSLIVKEAKNVSEESGRVTQSTEYDFEVRRRPRNTSRRSKSYSSGLPTVDEECEDEKTPLEIALSPKRSHNLQESNLSNLRKSTLRKSNIETVPEKKKQSLSKLNDLSNNNNISNKVTPNSYIHNQTDNVALKRPLNYSKITDIQENCENHVSTEYKFTRPSLRHHKSRDIRRSSSCSRNRTSLEKCLQLNNDYSGTSAGKVSRFNDELSYESFLDISAIPSDKDSKLQKKGIYHSTPLRTAINKSNIARTFLNRSENRKSSTRFCSSSPRKHINQTSKSVFGSSSLLVGQRNTDSTYESSRLNKTTSKRKNNFLNEDLAPKKHKIFGESFGSGNSKLQQNSSTNEADAVGEINRSSDNSFLETNSPSTSVMALSNYKKHTRSTTKFSKNVKFTGLSSETNSYVDNNAVSLKKVRFSHRIVSLSTLTSSATSISCNESFNEQPPVKKRRGNNETYGSQFNSSQNLLRGVSMNSLELDCIDSSDGLYNRTEASSSPCIEKNQRTSVFSEMEPTTVGEMELTAVSEMPTISSDCSILNRNLFAPPTCKTLLKSKGRLKNSDIDDSFIVIRNKRKLHSHENDSNRFEIEDICKQSEINFPDWVSPQFLEFIFKKFTVNYGLKATLMTERLICNFCATVSAISCINNPEDIMQNTLVLRNLLLKYNICSNRLEYYTIISRYTPFDFQRKVLPSGSDFGRAVIVYSKAMENSFLSDEEKLDVSL